LSGYVEEFIVPELDIIRQWAVLKFKRAISWSKNVTGWHCGEFGFARGEAMVTLHIYVRLARMSDCQKEGTRSETIKSTNHQQG